MSEQFGGATIAAPSGTIMLWDDRGNNAPPGWVYCDGNNGTPDLRGRYVKSVTDGTTDPGATGGVNSFMLGQNQMPSHTHSADFSEHTKLHEHDIQHLSSSVFSDTDSHDQWTTSGDGDADVFSNMAGKHNHTFNIETAGAGSDNIDNQPKHMKLAFIQKL